MKRYTGTLPGGPKPTRDARSTTGSDRRIPLDPRSVNG